ncbi:MAG: hypothetical protein JWN89_663 [Parcubacteria group bacterium]|nr:hypothetical protein [Parcubacteria group bacterium]
MQDARSHTSAKVIAESVYRGSRLTTFEIVFPRIILAEFNTHRLLSRNSASSRAYPTWKGLVKVVEYPFVPSQFGKNKAGMQSTEDVSEGDLNAARQNWLVGRDVAVIQAFYLAGGYDEIMRNAKGDQQAEDACRRIDELAREYPDVVRKMKALSVGVHKQHANRVLEPYAWHTVVATGAHWRNFYGLRASKEAQPEIREAAIAMIDAHLQSVPRELDCGEWHLPFITSEDREEVKEWEPLARVSSARCGRTSTLTHDGHRSISEDLTMADRLQGPGHMSPFEHPARAPEKGIHWKWSKGGNFGRPWTQYRKMLQGEHDFSRLASPEDLLLGVGGDQKRLDFILSLNE